MAKDPRQLTDMQEYIGREMVEEFRAGNVTRRAMLRTISIVCGSVGGAALLSACGDDEGAKALTKMDASATSADASTSRDTAATSPDGGAPDAAAATGDAAATTGDAGKGVLSVAADDPAITASMVQYDSTGMTKVTAYLARPKAAGNFPGVIVIHENRGLNDHVRDVARRLAKANFVALAPDLTSRWGTTAMLDPDMARMYLSMDGVTDNLVADLNAGVDHLTKVMGVVPADRLGVVGFCFGGGYTYRLAAANPKIVAAVPYYGPAPAAVVASLSASKAAFLVQHAEMDTNVNATREEVRAALAGKTFEIVVHPGTRHAFNNDTGANYNEAAAVAAWTKTLDWFRTHLK
jgi:carboxymethylenebutenolidase